MSKFYTYNQNNSFGRWEIDFDRGINIHVIVEAESVKDAHARAEEIGLYFNGCKTGRDCHCCGDRWSTLNESCATDTPMVYGELAAAVDSPWIGKPVCIHYLDGRIEVTGR